MATGLNWKQAIMKLILVVLTCILHLLKPMWYFPHLKRRNMWEFHTYFNFFKISPKLSTECEQIAVQWNINASRVPELSVWTATVSMCCYSGNNAITVCFEFGRFIHTAPLIPPGLMKIDMAFFRVTLLLFEGGLQMQRMFLLFG